MAEQPRLAITTTSDREREMGIIRLIRRELGEEVELGVKIASVLKLIQTHELDQDEVGAIVHARKNFNAALRKISELLKSGLRAHEIHALYEVRDNIANTFVREDSNMVIALTSIHELTEAFSELDLDNTESLTDQLVGTIDVLRTIFPHIKYADTLLKIVLETQADFNCCYLDTVVEMIQERQAYIKRNLSAYERPASKREEEDYAQE